MSDERDVMVALMPGRVMCRHHSGIWGGDDFCSKAKKREE